MGQAMSLQFFKIQSKGKECFAYKAAGSQGHAK